MSRNKETFHGLSTNLDGHDARNYGTLNARRPAPLDVSQKRVRFVEKLGDDEVRARVHLVS